MSSTYLKVEILLPSGLTSLIIAKNIIGPNFVPCGTPACKVDQSEHVEWYRTHCWRAVKKSAIQGII